MNTTRNTKQGMPARGAACEQPENIIEPVTGVPSAGYLVLKRGLDIALSLAALLLLAVPMVLIGLAVWLESRGPAVFKQQRMGQNGKVFTIYKFRTMKLPDPGKQTGREAGEVTKLGRFLRRSSMDELPQLVNVLKGDMSLIGYRPICLAETELNDLRLRCGVFVLRPGITGLAQVKGRDALDYVQKVQLDVQYVNRCSLKMDIWCLLQTVRTVISGEGVN